MKEVDVARPVVEEYRRQGHEVYQEVGLELGGGVADIVTDHNRQLWIIEAKVSLSWDLMAQASGRKDWANRVSVAVPQRRWKYKTRRYVAGLMRREGIGLIFVDRGGHMTEIVVPAVVAKPLWLSKLRKCLNDAQKDYVEAGTAGGGHWTPYKETCAEVLKAVTATPGLTAREVVDSIPKHHYHSDASARGGLVARGQDGLIPGVEVRKNGRFLAFFPKAGA